MKSHLSPLILLSLLLGSACDPNASTQVLQADVSFGPSPLVLDLFFDETRTFEVDIQNRGDAYFSVLGTSQQEGTLEPRVLIAFDDGPFAVPPGASTFVLRLSPLSLGQEEGALVFDTEEGEVQVPFVAQVREVPNCDDQNPCTRDRFDRQLRVCVSENLDDQSRCSFDDDRRAGVGGGRSGGRAG